MSAISYQALERVQQEIRLIVLEDSPKFSKKRLFGDSSPPPLKCSIIHTSLDNYTTQEAPSSAWRGLTQRSHPKYFALSYVWGDPDPVCEITINGAPAKIARSLHEALSSIRDNTDFRIIWADAICINQNDNIEKSWQVQQMTSIYKYADTVIAWLGPSSGDSDLAMSTLQAVNRLLKKESFRKAKRYEDPSAYAQRQLQQTLDKFLMKRSTEFKAITKVWKRPYWTRVWIIQEIAISRKTLFLCGSYQSEDVEVALLAVSEFASYTVWTDNDPPKLLSMGEIYLINRQPEFMKITDMAQQLQNHCLYQLLFYCHGGSHGYRAFNPRDYVYAILGLAADQRSLGIVIDYEKSTELVYNDVVRRVVASGYTDILALAVAKKAMANLPTWVPDFSNIGHVFFCTFKTAQAEKHESPIIPHHGGSNGLPLRGLTIGVITNIAPEPPSGMFMEDESFLGSFLQWLLAIESELFLSPVEESKQSWRNPHPIVIGTPRQTQDRGRIARSLFANMDPTTGYRIDDPRDAEILYILILLYRNNPDGLLTRLTAAEATKRTRDADAIGMGSYLSGIVQQAMKGCRVYRLDTGHIGLASPGCQVGDKVMEIPGGSFPFVVRTIEDASVSATSSEDTQDEFPSDSGMPSYNLVGMAWLDWMVCWKLWGTPAEEHFLLY
jgi:hypothetical protein